VAVPASSMLDDLVELSRLLVGVAYRSLDGLGTNLDLPSFRALAFVERNAGCTMGAFATGTALAPSSATRLCDRMVEQDWLIRQNRPDNRRQVELSLSSTGRKLVRAALSARRAELSRVVAHLPRDRQRLLTDLLPELVAAASNAEPFGSVAWAV
jgi:DNA-binding MarR family transcriptional regulator